MAWETPIKETPPSYHRSLIIGIVHAIKFNSIIPIVMIRSELNLYEFICIVCDTTNLELGTVGNLMGIWCNWWSYWLKIQSILLLDFIQHGNGSCGPELPAARGPERSSPHFSHIYTNINQEQNKDEKITRSRRCILGSDCPTKYMLRILRESAERES